MLVGIVGRKCGMTRVFTPTGDAIPVTVIQIEPNQVVQVKTDEHDGYSAIQVKVGLKAANIGSSVMSVVPRLKPSNAEFSARGLPFSLSGAIHRFHSLLPLPQGLFVSHGLLIVCSFLWWW